MQTSFRLYQPCLLGLLNIFIEQGYVSKCPAAYSHFLQCLGSNYPVCGLVHNHPGFIDILKQITAGVDVTNSPDNLILIEQQFPVLSELFSTLQWEIPSCLKDIITELITRAEAPFNQRKIHELPLCGDNCDCTGIGYFPNLPKHCHRGEYVLDDKRKQKEEITGSCSKRSLAHKTLIPGLFTLSCVHGKSIDYCFCSICDFNMQVSAHEHSLLKH